MKKQFLALSIIVLSAALSSPAVQAANERPNLLFCLADDWGWPHAGAYGDPVVKTPAFDRLAREGVLFEYAFVSSPSCTPSRNALITGQQFYRLGQGANLWSTLDVKHPNFMFMLREAGYEIGHWRKAWGPGDANLGGYQEHPCGPGSRFAAFMAKRDKSKPFCFWFGTSDPHRPYDKGSGKRSGIDVDRIRVPAFLPDQDEVRNDIADYYFEVQRWDRDVGQALQLLEENGALDDTLIVMSGDHGMPFPRCKGNLYDWGSRVPLAMRWGKHIAPNRTLTDFVSFTDIAPTFLEAAGIDIPKEMTGHSLLALLKGDREGRIDRKRDFMVFGRERHTPAQQMPSMNGYPSRAIRTDKWMLVVNLEPERWPAGVPEGATFPINTFPDCDAGPTKSFVMRDKDSVYYEQCFGLRGSVELYNCESDPDQFSNLAGHPEYTGIVTELRARLVAYLERTGDPRFTDESVKFDTYPYQGANLKGYLKKHGY